MATTAADSRSLGGLLRDLANDSANLVRQELVLTRTEAQDKLHQTVTASKELMAGALVLLAALIVLLDAAVYSLIEEVGLEHWQAALIVGGVVAVIGFVLVRRGQGQLAATRLAPERTVASVRKDLELVKEQLS